MHTFDECVNYIMNIPKFQGKNTLEDTAHLVDAKDGFDFKIINVAGTNGKGSVTSYISSILRESGRKVGIFTSPHLTDIRERISIDGKYISKEDFAVEFEKVLKAVKEGKANHPSFFEFLFVMCMNYFRRKEVDVVILEAGMGGRLDATNCITGRSLSVITQIGLDHTEYLGETKELIAAEKAGIIENGVPVVFWKDDKSVSEVIEKIAEKKKSPCFSTSDKDILIQNVSKEGIDFSFRYGYYYFERLHINSYAEYQVKNACLSIAAVLSLSLEDINEDVISAGLLAMKWPARMEEIAKDVYLDGAHNPNGIEAFLKAVRNIPVLGRRVLLFGVVSDKDYDLMADMILDSALFEHIILAPIDSERGLSKERLSDIFASAGDRLVESADSVSEAFKRMLNIKSEEDVCFIAGSLYLAGEIKAIMDIGEK